MSWWHAFGHVREDLGGCYQLVVYGGSDMGPDEVQEIAPTLADQLGGYLASWDHQPSELEKETVTPAEYRDEFGPLAHTIPADAPEVGD